MLQQYRRSVKTFQQRMVIFGKRITLLTSKDDLTVALTTYKEPLIIVFHFRVYLFLPC